ncbi:hypothetical protein LNTAR_17658 [Lentisphaera araneosa HTCC2155]|uniref:Uncharacterized protein n=1 Tax=Lentisphaera araneosa HTCC2155 TaxID=313628 RepID=A6DFL7_9BACT|nr:hypothetical protein LNTAR_17643 [Lentisphaera araneosa HTCC2155]EDM29600.1 hypothetical protein LNTAR_17658 [Lentisphaera araneosa HTCC2155]
MWKNVFTLVEFDASNKRPAFTKKNSIRLCQPLVSSN